MEGGTENSAVSIRRAVEDEAEVLSSLALRSKAHWGYDADFIEGCRPLLTVSQEAIAELPVFVLENRGRIVGFYGLRKHDEFIELLYLFVEPSEINRGYGKLLWSHAIEAAVTAGKHRLLIESDPNAEEFYRAMGARKIGEMVSPLDASRILPLMEYSLEASRVEPNSY